MTNLSVSGLDLDAYMQEVGKRARAAARVLAQAPTRAKNATLAAAAVALRRDSARLLAANAEDVAGAKAAGEDAAFIDRLTLKPAGVAAMAEGLEQIATLPDPVLGCTRAVEAVGDVVEASER